jgi:hypothetical protein
VDHLWGEREALTVKLRRERRARGVQLGNMDGYISPQLLTVSDVHFRLKLSLAASAFNPINPLIEV